MDCRRHCLLPLALLTLSASAAHGLAPHGGTFPPPPPVDLPPTVSPGGTPHPVGPYSGPGYAPGDTSPGAPPGPASTPAGAPEVPGAPPAPGAPVTPGNFPRTAGAAPAVAGAPSSGIGMVVLDRSRWSDWWELNRGPYLNLKQHLYAVHAQTGSDDFFLGHGARVELPTTLKPTGEQIERMAEPALRRALERADSVDIVTGAMMALAKIGGNRREEQRDDFAELFAAFLDDGSQEVRETAALALGALGDESARGLLTALLRDDARGRKLVRKSRVADRTRAFAAYGLGLYARRCELAAGRAVVARELTAVLDAGARSTPDLELACVTALGLVPAGPGGASRASARSSSTAAADTWKQELEGRAATLLGLLDDKRRSRTVRAHVPAALARVHASVPISAPELRETIRMALVARLSPRAKDAREVVQGAALALGELGVASDMELVAALTGLHDRGPGLAERGFALVSLARVGGRPAGEQGHESTDAVTRTLLESLASGALSRRAWAALALGVQAHGLRAAGRQPSADGVRALRRILAERSSPELVAAAAIGLGLSGDVDSTSLLLAKLPAVRVDAARGYLCESLGLLGAREALEPLQVLVAESQFRPLLLTRAAIALGMLEDTYAVPQLLEMLGSAKSLAGQAGLAIAIGTIGDARTLPSLAHFLEDGSKTQTARAFAAVALGLASDTSLLPWNEPLRNGVQYRAVTVTLISESGTGVLEIL